MRPIHLARLGKLRPVLLLTREQVRFERSQVTVAPITGTIRGLPSEVIVDHRNGLEKQSVVQCDNIITIPAEEIERNVGFLLDWQEELLTEAIRAAFDLR